MLARSLRTGVWTVQFDLQLLGPFPGLSSFIVLTLFLLEDIQEYLCNRGNSIKYFPSVDLNNTKK